MRVFSRYRDGEPLVRRLNGFALDPGASQSIATAMVSKTIFRVPWEKLRKGPCGEYIEVVDVDPASGCFYAPADLDDPLILAQDGHAPAEGNPQFHQQMVYAVAMTTVQTFEHALGRPAMWADGAGYKFVRQLRIYPHALREANAYYSPAKVALLFGYFPAERDPEIGQFPGGMVFSCLSHDIIAHETSHALLDGFHPGFLEPSNDDVLAFHEAFSDIVALFQRFSFPEVLAHQITTTRGDLNEPNLMARLASEFGQAIGSRGALRDAIGKVDRTTGKWSRTKPDPTALESTFQPHDRGAILVAAVFDAFLQIYRTRTADLFRIASGGTGVLPAGDLHPDLVKRLSDEASKAAGHVLGMCIRALDYCPPVDLTFGEFLRALITADADLVPGDPLGYRVAFIESFRRHGVYPEKVRTMSEDSLKWKRIDELDVSDAENEVLMPLFDRIADHIDKIRRIPPGPDGYREKLWEASKSARAAINVMLKQSTSKSNVLERLTGLALRRADATRALPDGVKLNSEGNPSFEVRGFHESRRHGEGGRVLNQVFVTLIQKQTVEIDGEIFELRNGATLVADMDEQKFTYAIRKGINSEDRIARTADFLARFSGSSLSATYLRGDDELLAALHRHT
jgi:hypothetical protein